MIRCSKVRFRFRWPSFACRARRHSRHGQVRPSGIRIALLAMALPVLALPRAPCLAAQDPPGAALSSAQSSGTDPGMPVVVTGTYLPRGDTETASPLQVITSTDMRRSGYTSIADVLHGITANNMGSLSQAAPTSLALGGAGVALRGLTLGATLVLIDGHRMAPYPLPDDGSREFVDIASLPVDAIDRIEVLKDGASAIYGSDAIAGVVNVILKHDVMGTTLGAETGRTSMGDGSTRQVSLSSGWGDTAADGHHTQVLVDARAQDAIALRDRPYLAITDWRPYGGANLTQGTGSGAVSGASSGAGSGTGYLTDAAGHPIHYFAGCTSMAAAADRCGYANPYLTLQPATDHQDLLVEHERALQGTWRVDLQASALRSQIRQVGLYDNAATTGVGSGANGGGVNLFRFGPGVGPAPAFAGQLPFILTVPAGSPGNDSGAPARLVYDFRDLGPLTQEAVSSSYRGVAALSGTSGPWDLHAAAGYTRVVTQASFYDYVDFPALQAALDEGTYVVGAQNPPSVDALVAPLARSTSTSGLSFLSARGSRDAMTLPGGPASVGIGVEFTRHVLDERLPGAFAQGAQNLATYAFAVGQQSVTAAYLEAAAPLTRRLELDVAARVDDYAGGADALTPKLGAKFLAIPELTVRATYGQGFRAPSPAQTGNAGGTSGFVGGFYDPARCPHGVSTGVGANPSCDIALQELQVATPDLKPERSTSYTVGLIATPDRRLDATIDYYRIAIRDQIISAGQLGQIALDDAARLGTVLHRDAQGALRYVTTPFINADSTVTSGIDVDLRARLDLAGGGRVQARLQSTYLMTYDLTAQGVTYHLAGTHGPSYISEDTGTPRTRAAADLTWMKGRLELTGSVDYLSGFAVTDPSAGIVTCAQALASEFPRGNPPAQFCRVASFMEFNAEGQFKLDGHWQLHFGVVNLLNRHAPYDLQTYGSAGNGPQQGGAPYNPSMHQDGALGTMITFGAAYAL